MLKLVVEISILLKKYFVFYSGNRLIGMIFAERERETRIPVHYFPIQMYRVFVRTYITFVQKYFQGHGIVIIQCCDFFVSGTNSCLKTNSYKI